jgi:hypothetical protein
LEDVSNATDQSCRLLRSETVEKEKRDDRIMASGWQRCGQDVDLMEADPRPVRGFDPARGAGQHRGAEVDAGNLRQRRKLDQSGEAAPVALAEHEDGAAVA